MKIQKPFFLAMLCVALLGWVLVAQESQNISLLSSFGKGEGESKGVFAAGSLVFYGLGSKIQIASFSDPANPVKISSVVLSDVVESVVRTSINSTLYLVASGGSKVWLINVQDPTKPTLVSTTDLGGGVTCEGVATSGTYAYVAAGGGGFKIYSIATPSAPVLVASVDSLAYCESVVISSPYAYIAAGSRSFIVDISTPSAPVYKSRIGGYGGYHQYMNVRSGYAYICNYDAGLQVVNVSNPTSPVNVVAIPSGYRTASIVFDGNYGYVAVGDSGMYIYNVVNPAAPVLEGKIMTTGRAAFVSYGAITIGGVPKGHIYVSNRNPVPGLSAINVSVPATPTLSAFLSALAAATGIAYTPFYANGKVYVAYGTAGLRILDVSNPANVTLLSTTALGGDSRAVVVSGNYAYLAARDSGVFVVDVTNPASPTKLKTIKTRTARGVAVNGNYVYVAASDSGVGILNITNPAAPTIVGFSHPNGHYGENVVAAGNVMGLTDYTKILFFDATNPAAPVSKGLTSAFKTGNEGFAIADNFAYVPDGDTLKIFNITNLLSPAQVSKISTGGYGYTAAVFGKYCYVASEGTGVRAIDITNPAVPVEAGYYDGVPMSRGVAANDKYIYVAEKADGVTVYSNDVFTSVASDGAMIPASPALHQNYPNPFNPSTTISIELTHATFASLEIFNTLGQKVATLLSGYMPAGAFNIPFNASALPSGVYMYRLHAEGATFVRKMVLMK
jgi:hypothetical protein